MRNNWGLLCIISIFVQLTIWSCGKNEQKSEYAQIRKEVITVDTIANDSDLIKGLTEYDTSKHSDFNIFWKHFKDAVKKNDKYSILQMTVIPFEDINRDIYDPAFGSRRSLTSKTKMDFIDKYDKLFCLCAKSTISTARFRKFGHFPDSENYPVTGPGLYKLENGNYLLELDCLEPHLFLFEKTNGIFKLTSIPYEQ